MEPILMTVLIVIISLYVAPATNTIALKDKKSNIVGIT